MLGFDYILFFDVLFSENIGAGPSDMDRGGLWAKTEDIAHHWGERVKYAWQRLKQTICKMSN